jgi:hypothetical protein
MKDKNELRANLFSDGSELAEGVRIALRPLMKATQ